MARLLHEFLDQNGIIAKGGPGLAHGTGQRIGEILGRINLAHALAAAARHGLDQNGIADRIGGPRQMLWILVGPVIARNHRNARALHQHLGRILQPHLANGITRGANENQPGGLDRIHEIGVLRQEPVAGMDRLGPCRQRGFDDRFAPQIAFGGCRSPDMNRLIGHIHMGRTRIRIGINRNAAHSHAPAGLDHPTGDLTPVRNQDLGKHRAPSSGQDKPHPFFFAEILRGARGAGPSLPPSPPIPPVDRSRQKNFP